MTTVAESLRAELERAGKSTDDILFVYLYPVRNMFFPMPEEKPYLIDTELFLEAAEAVDEASETVQVLVLGDGFVATREPLWTNSMNDSWRVLRYDETINVRPDLVDIDEVKG